MSKKTRSVCAALLLSLTGASLACRDLGIGPPESLEDCLLGAADKGSAESMARSEMICRRVFSFAVTGRGLPVGEYFYLGDSSFCQTVVVDPAGRLAFGDDSFCGAGSRLERGAGGELTLACLNHRKTGESRVFDAAPTPRGLNLSENDRVDAVLYATLSACERRRIADSKELRAAAPAARSPAPAPAPAPAVATPPVAKPTPTQTAKPAPKPVPSGSAAARKCCACLSSGACLRGGGEDCATRLSSSDWSKVNTMCLSDNCEAACEELE